MNTTLVKEEMDTMSRVIKAWSLEGLTVEERPKVWSGFLSTSVTQLQACTTPSYADLLGQIATIDPKIRQEIQKDLSRTNFLSTPAQEQQLLRILQCYALRNPKIGYCQGMNALGAFLIHHMENEQESFWSLVCLVEELLPGYHRHTLAGLHIDQRVLDQLIENRLPQLFHHLQLHHMTSVHFSTRWLVSVFLSSTLPQAVVSRIWDALLSCAPEGFGACRILFGTALTILSHVQHQLLVCTDAGAMLEVIQSFTIFSSENSDARQQDDERTFVQNCFFAADRITLRDVFDLRKKFQRTVVAETEAMDVMTHARGSRHWVMHDNRDHPDQYQITFDVVQQQHCGLTLRQKTGRFQRVRRHQAQLPEIHVERVEGLAQSTGMITPGDIVVDINSIPCTGKTIQAIHRILHQVSIRPYSIRFQKPPSPAIESSGRRKKTFFSRNASCPNVTIMSSPVVIDKSASRRLLVDRKPVDAFESSCIPK